jgi:hypothetical protein
VADEFYDPVVRVWMALYGLYESGFSYDDLAEGTMVKLGWKTRDGSGPIYIRDRTLCVRYVDDLIFAGPVEQAWKFAKELAEHLKLSMLEVLKEFLSIHFNISRLAPGVATCEATQREYAEALIERFMLDSKLQHLGKATTPLIKNRTAKDDDNDPGFYDCRAHNGGLWYLARGTRWDLLLAVNVMSRYLDKWTKQHDRMLVRIFEYVNATLDFGHVMTVHDADYKDVTVQTYVDSDLGGCPSTRRSTTGIVCGVVGPHGTRAFTDASAKRQGSGGPSTPHVEVIAIDEGLRRVHLPMLGVMEFALQRKVVSSMLSDATGAISSVRKGGTRSDLQYMTTYPGVSFAFSHDFFYGVPRGSNQKLDTLDHVPGGENHSDMFTKPLDALTFAKHRDAIGIRAIKKRS